MAEIFTSNFGKNQNLAKFKDTGAPVVGRRGATSGRAGNELARHQEGRPTKGAGQTVHNIFRFLAALMHWRYARLAIINW